MKNVRRIVTILLTMAMMMSFVTSVMAISFSDLDASHWAYEYITTLADKGVINGYTDGTFRPSGNITRAEFLKLITAISYPQGIIDEIKSNYTDHWTTPYVKLAEKLNMINPYQWDIEQLNQPITRIEMVQIVSRGDLFSRKLAVRAGDLDFSDVNDLEEADTMYLTHAVIKGYITGYEDGTFKPEKNMTRAEATTVVLRYKTIK